MTLLFWGWLYRLCLSNTQLPISRYDHRVKGIELDSNRELFEDLSNADLDLMDAILDRFEAEQASTEFDSNALVDFSTWLDEVPENLRGGLLEELIVLQFVQQCGVSAQEIDLDEAETRFKKLWPDYRTQIESGFKSVRREIQENPAAPHNTEQPIEVGRFRIVREIGRGGMGVVYLGYDSRLRRPVALKVLLAAIHSSPAIRQRFLQESETAARLQHENVVRVYEAGEHEGLPFMALEYIDGPHLGKLVEGQPQSAKQAAQWVQRLASAVQAAHEAGIVHRDLKPSNILVQAATKFADASTIAAHLDGSTNNAMDSEVEASSIPVEGGEPILKITDFGLAKDMSANSDLTMSGAVLGTAQFMSPEQASGKVQDVGPPADIYGLGAVLYYLLTGRSPFLRSGPLETLKAVQREEVLPPRTLVPTIPKDLETICLRCLQKSPAQRFGSATELSEELDRFLNNQPILSRPIGLLQRGWRWCQNNSSVAFLIAAVFLVLALGTATTSWQWWEAVKTNRNLVETQGELEEKTETAIRATRDAKAADLVARLERDNSQLREATLTLENALEMAQQGEVNEGLAWMMQALHTLPATATWQKEELQSRITAMDNAIRINLNAWAPYALQRLFTHENELVIDQTGESLIWIQDQSIFSVDLELASQPKHLIDLDYVPSRCWLDPEGKFLASEVDLGDGGLGVWHMHAWDLESGEKLADINYLNIHTSLHGCLFTGNGRLVCRLGTTFRSWDLRKEEPSATTRSIEAGPIQLLGDGEFFTDHETVWDSKTLETIESSDPRVQELVDVHTPTERNTRSHMDIRSESELAVVQLDPFDRRLRNRSTGEELMTFSSLRFGTVTSRNLDFMVSIFDYFRLPKHFLRQDLARKDFVDDVVTQGSLVAFSDNGESCAIARRNRMQRIDIGPAAISSPPIYHPIEVQNIAINTDGSLVASAIQNIMSDDIGGNIIISGANGERIVGPMRHTNWIGALAFSPDGKTLVAGDFHGRVRFWDTETGNEKRPWINLPEIPVSLKFTRDGNYLAVGTSDDRNKKGLVQFYHVAADYKELGRAELPRRVGLGEFVAAGEQIIAKSFTEFQLLEATSGHPIASWETESELSIWTQAGTVVAACTQPKEVGVFDLGKEHLIGMPIALPLAATHLALNSNAGVCAAAAADGSVRFYDTAAGVQLGPALQTWQDIVALRYASKGELFQILTGSGEILSWRIAAPIRGEVEDVSQAMALASSFRVNEQFALKPVAGEEWPKLDAEELPTVTSYELPAENLQTLELAAVHRCVAQGNPTAALLKSEARLSANGKTPLELSLALGSDDHDLADAILKTAAATLPPEEVAALLNRVIGELPQSESKSRDWCFTNLLELLPDEFELFTEHANSLNELGQDARAEEQLRRASELCDDPLWLPWFVNESLSNSDLESAITAYYKLAELEQLNATHTQRFAKLLVLAGRDKDYQELVTKSLDQLNTEYKSQGFLEIWRYCWIAGLGDIKQEDATRSIEIAERVWELGKESRFPDLAMTTKGLALLRANQIDELNEFFSQRPLDSSNQMLPYEQLILSIGHARTGRLAEAGELFESVSAPPDVDAIVQGELALLYLEAKSLLPENLSP